MSSIDSEKYCIVDRNLEDDAEILETPHKMPDRKLITTVQICLRCRRTMPCKSTANAAPTAKTSSAQRQ